MDHSLRQTEKSVLLWFRQDLRLHDNPILHHAISEGLPVIALYILDDESPGPWAIGAAGRWWLYYSLKKLSQDLATYNVPLILRRGHAKKVLQDVIGSTTATHIFWNRCYEPYTIKRDQEIKTWLTTECDVQSKSFNGGLLYEPWTIKTLQGEPYKVFTPYWRACQTAGLPRPVLEYDLKNLKPCSASCMTLTLEDLTLLPEKDWAKEFHSLWNPGEAGAYQKLNAFLKGPIDHYHEMRNRPDLYGTSRLSPHLHFGEISPHQIYHQACIQSAQDGKEHLQGLEVFLSELGWREFSYYLLYHFPHLPDDVFQQKFQNFPWDDNPTLLKKWQKGQTGIPIVDAGMRELWHTGWMHNRLRMIVGSLLTKNMGLDWRQGEKWFWDCLVDADLASNASGWQWIAGSGADAQPYFRIFNPIMQAEKFDPKGDYIRKWVPEIATLPVPHLYAPWKAPEAILQKAGVKIGETYPGPCVDLQESRHRALTAYEQIKNNKATE